MGRMMVGKYSIHDTHPHGSLTVAEVFKFSSNIGATKIARKLGRDGLADALASFGFGKPTGVGLPGERGGVIRPVEKWGDIGFANVSFGQGLTVTPLQMVTGVSAIAGGGIYRQPRIVSRIVQPDGSVETLPAAPERRVMAPAAARTMLSIMRGVTEAGGTAKQAAIDGYVVGGKTGTAQKVANGHYDPDRWVSSFVGVVPAENPRLAIIIVVDEPQGGHLGGAVRRRSSTRSPSRRCATCTSRPRSPWPRAARRQARARPATSRRRAARARAQTRTMSRPMRGPRPSCRSTTKAWATTRRWPRRGTRSPAPRRGAPTAVPRRQRGWSCPTSPA
jgi:cell division protein FtsI (penicillin-binding protein 3)